MDKNDEIFVIHVAALSATPIHLSREVQMGALLANKAPTQVLAKYSNYADVLSSDLAMELPEHTSINDYAIDLVEGKQLPYVSMYSLG